MLVVTFNDGREELIDNYIVDTDDPAEAISIAKEVEAKVQEGLEEEDQNYSNDKFYQVKALDFELLKSLIFKETEFSSFDNSSKIFSYEQ